MNLLLVDDSTYIRESAKAELKNTSEFNYFEAPDYNAAFEILKKESIDILLVDTVLPGLSGAKLTEKTLTLKSDLKIFGLSTQNKGLTHKKLLSSGALKILKKPITLESLKNAIQEYTI